MTGNLSFGSTTLGEWRRPKKSNRPHSDSNQTWNVTIYHHEPMTQPNSPPNRNKEIRRVRVADLEDAPWNFREHDDTQNAAFGGTVEEIGWYGYPDVYETADGLRICDGHLRKAWLLQAYGPDAEIEVNVTDFDERDAKVATLTHDTLAGLATIRPDRLGELMAGFDTQDEALQEMLDGLAAEQGSFDVQGGDMPNLPSGDREPFQQMTFTVSDDQAETIKAALADAKAAGPFIDTGNENSNGNALARLAEAYCG
jgi:hypothetical protein